jgi:hypothetical protein
MIASIASVVEHCCEGFVKKVVPCRHSGVRRCFGGAEAVGDDKRTERTSLTNAVVELCRSHEYTFDANLPKHLAASTEYQGAIGARRGVEL